MYTSRSYLRLYLLICFYCMVIFPASASASPSPAPVMTFVNTDVYKVCSVNWSDVPGPKSSSFTIKQGQPAEVKSQQ